MGDKKKKVLYKCATKKQKKEENVSFFQEPPPRSLSVEKMNADDENDNVQQRDAGGS